MAAMQISFDGLLSAISMAVVAATAVGVMLFSMGRLVNSIPLVVWGKNLMVVSACALGLSVMVRVSTGIMRRVIGIEAPTMALPDAQPFLSVATFLLVCGVGGVVLGIAIIALTAYSWSVFQKIEAQRARWLAGRPPKPAALPQPWSKGIARPDQLPPTHRSRRLKRPA